VPSAAVKYLDRSTEFEVVRLTDPAVSSRLPASYGRSISRRSNFLVYASDATGHMEAYRMDLKNGTSRQLTDADNLDPASITLTGDERSFCCLDAGRLLSINLSSLRAREVYKIPQGFVADSGMSIAEDGLFAALVEHKGSHYRLQLIRMADGSVVTLAEADEEIHDPIPRPKRASVLYRRGDGAWLANYDGQQNYRMRLADGQTAQALWSPDGRSVQYLNYPTETRKLHNLREFVPDTNEDSAMADTSQFIGFDRNGDSSVFVGASGSKATPHVLLLVRVVKRELTLCEHRASDPRLVAPVFAPNSQHIYFTSDQHGKPAIYSMAIEKLVSETENP